MLIELFQSVDYHHWFLFGLGLLVMEVFFGGILLLWLGMFALLLALIVLVFPGLNWQLQFLLYGIFCIASIVLKIQYSFAQAKQERERKQALAKPEGLYTGCTYTLEKPVHKGHGYLNIDGIDWVLDAGEADIDAGKTVRVVEQKISTLVVEVAGEEDRGGKGA